LYLARNAASAPVGDAVVTPFYVGTRSVDDWLTPEDYAKMNFDWRRFHPDMAEAFKKGQPSAQDEGGKH
jgi:hypothetical protein